jgi:hypothetical protein
LDDTPVELFSPALQRIREADPFAAIEFLHRADDPIAVMKAYRDLVNHLYWKEKDLPTAVSLLLAGIAYGLTYGNDQGSAELRYDLKSLAKTLAYNLASFAWPGWDEPGIVIGATVAAVGLDAAQLNLRLAEELNKGDLPLSRGHWMLGAQYLAAKDYEKARHHFDEGARFAEAAGSTAEIWLCFGFAALVRMLASPENQAARADLDHIKSRLAEMEGGKDFLGQIETAESVWGIGSLGRWVIGKGFGILAYRWVGLSDASKRKRSEG